MHHVGSMVGVAEPAARVGAAPAGFRQWPGGRDDRAAVPARVGVPFSLLGPEWFATLGFDVARAGCLESLARCLPPGWSVGEGAGRFLDARGRARTELMDLSVPGHVVALRARYTVGLVPDPQTPGMARVAVCDAGRPVRLSPEFDASDPVRRTEEYVWMSLWLDSEVPGHESPLALWDSTFSMAA